MSFATAMRHSSRYCIGGIPTVRLKRSANTARDSPATRASSATVHRRATSTWIRCSARKRCVGEPGQEALLLLRGRHRPKPQHLDEQHLDEPLEDRIAAGPLHPRLLTDQLRGLPQPLRSCLPTADMND